MALVDYSSEGSDSDSDSGKTTRQKKDDKTKTNAPPPLPRAFYDLYAATVRTAPVDHPSLHNGRQRAIPHIAGQWPSHLYIEWLPSSLEYDRLGELLSALRGRLDGAAADLHSLLKSDLGVPLPLHISLSRPFVLQTAAKADFLRQLTATIRSAGVSPFSVVFSDLFWFRGPDSARAFLVLRARVEGSSSSSSSSTFNRPLVTLLDRCNGHVTAAGQPALYSGDASSTARSFHVSIAWTLADIETWREPTREVYERWRHSRDTPKNDADRGEERLRIHVESIKAKIGNVVTDIPLGKTTLSTSRPGRKRSRGEERESQESGDNTTSGSNKKSAKGNDTHRQGKTLFGI